MRNILFVVNPVSGGNSKAFILAEIDAEIELRGFTHDIFYTSTDFFHDSKRLASFLNKSYYDRVIAVGGDGTILLVAQNLIGRGISLGIIPFGSANGMATELEIPSSPLLALENSLDSNERAPLDILLINEEFYSLHLGDIGTNARIVQKFEKEESRGLLSYARNFFSSVNESEILQLEIEADGTMYRREGFMLAIANARKYGTGTVINPNGRLDDGKFELVILLDLDFSTLASSFATLINEDRVLNHVEVISCSEATIRLSHPEVFQLDGEVRGKTQMLSVKMIPHALSYYRFLE